LETEDQQTPGRQQSPTSAISNAAVQILRRYSGRGPVKARTHINGDLVTVVLGDTLTTAERTLVDAGQWEHVEAARLKMQQVMKGDLVAVVEAETQRKVTAFISANHCDPDLAIESFVLAPQ
jgi:uncharacterized protein YbcI